MIPIKSQLATSSSPNPAYTHWIRQDALILSAIIATLTEPIVAQIASHQTSYDVWQALEKIFASQSKACVFHQFVLNSPLFVKVLNHTNYFFNIRKISDELAIAGQPLSYDDTITYILAGLGHDYDSLAATITARQDSVTSKELYSLLPITESIITANNTTSFFGNGSENLSTRQHNSFQPRSRGRGRGYYRTHHSNYHTSGRGQFNKDPIYYQLCDKPCQINCQNLLL